MLNKNNPWTRKHVKIVGIIAITLLLLILTINLSRALGIAPSRDIMTYDNEEHTYNLRIINNDHKDMKVLIIADGELAAYAQTKVSQLDIKSTESEKTFSYKIKLPTNLDPGERGLDLNIVEVPEGSSNSENTMITSSLAVKYQLKVNVPYPGLYADGVLYISSANVNDTVSFTANIINRGSDTIKSADGEIIIKGPTNEEIARIKTNRITNLNSKDVNQLTATWSTPNPGEYYAEVVVNYDNKQLILKKTFMVGKFVVDISDVKVENYKLGTTAKFDIDLVNHWNQPLQGFYGEVVIMDKSGNVLDTVNTVPTDLRALSTTTISAYWDTKNVNVGSYDVKVILHYADKVSEKIFGIILGIDAIKVQGFSSTGQVIGTTSTKAEGSSISLLFILVTMSIILNIGLFVYFKFLRKKNEP